jgi:AcrR family transcriptional regulator
MYDRPCYFFSMSPAPAPAVPAPRVDGRLARGDSTRRAILGRAMQLASAEGLEDLSIARLAADLGMSKSGLFAHFGSKEELQLSTLRAARRVFTDAAVVPAQDAKKGIVRLKTLLDTWLGYVGGETFAGGCLFMEASAEFDNRPGPVRDLIAETMKMWVDLLTEQAARAVERGELAEGTDPAQLTWELHAFGLGLNWDKQLYGSEAALERARKAVADRLAAAATGKGRRRLAALG